MSDLERESEQRFDRAREAFERASAAAGALGGGAHRFCGESVRLRIAGERLACAIEPPFEHLRETYTDPSPRLRVDLWDVRATGVPGLPDAVQHACGTAWPLTDGAFAISAGGRFASHELRGSVAWLDRRRGHLVGWFADAGDLTLHQRGKPLQMLLALWASDRGVQAVHAALVARGGRGVLVPGSSGAGKSTVALVCLQAGYSYVGDDWIGVRAEPDGSFVGHGLASSTYVEPAHARRFPLLGPHLVPPRAAEETKSLVFLSRVFGGRIEPQAAICALALPRIVSRRDTRVRPASKAEALLTLVPSSVFSLRPRPGREGVDRLAELAERIPAHWLELGPDLDTIARHIGEICAPGRGCP